MQDSGIEASGETEPRTERDALPEFTHSKNTMTCWNGTRTELDIYVDSGAANRISRWSFPPVLEEFNLMETETGPSELEDIFSDNRYMYIYYMYILYI